MEYIDMHCDTLMKAWILHKKDIYRTKTMVDLERLKKAGCRCQFFAIFMPPIGLKKKLGPLFPSDRSYISRNLSIFRNTAARHPNVLGELRGPGDLEKNLKAGRVSGLLTLEDGRAVDGSIEKLEQFFGEGIRLISLTWNNENCFGAPNSADKSIMEKGLSPFGKAAVRRMEELGMIVDVSHLSDGGFRDVAELIRGPFVASHSNCRALNPHPRSLSDDMIRTLAEHGGVMGLNFGPQFLSSDPKSRSSRISDMVLQLQHVRQIGGKDIMAIGSDFDGISGDFELGSPCDMHLLFEALDRAGFTEEEIEKLAFRNAERVMADILRA